MGRLRQTARKGTGPTGPPRGLARGKGGRGKGATPLLCAYTVQREHPVDSDYHKLQPCTLEEACQHVGVTVSKSISLDLDPATREALSRMEPHSDAVTAEVHRVLSPNAPRTIQMSKEQGRNCFVPTANEHFTRGAPVGWFSGILQEKAKADRVLERLDDSRHLWFYDIPASSLAIYGYAGPDLVLNMLDRGSELRFAQDAKWHNPNGINNVAAVLWVWRLKLVDGSMLPIPWIVCHAEQEIRLGAELQLDWGEECWAAYHQAQVVKQGSAVHRLHLKNKRLEQLAAEHSIDIPAADSCLQHSSKTDYTEAAAAAAGNAAAAAGKRPRSTEEGSSRAAKFQVVATAYGLQQRATSGVQQQQRGSGASGAGSSAAAAPAGAATGRAAGSSAGAAGVTADGSAGSNAQQQLRRLIVFDPDAEEFVFEEVAAGDGSGIGGVAGTANQGQDQDEDSVLEEEQQDDAAAPVSPAAPAPAAAGPTDVVTPPPNEAFVAVDNLQLQQQYLYQLPRSVLNAFDVRQDKGGGAGLLKGPPKVKVVDVVSLHHPARWCTPPNVPARAVVAAVNIKEGEAVIDYVGVVQTEQARTRNSSDDVLDQAYCMGMRTEELVKVCPALRGCLKTDLVIDSLQVGNEARFINCTWARELQQDGTPHVNCSWSVMWIKSLKRPVVRVYATRRIKAGEELVADYGSDYWVAMGRSLQVMQKDYAEAALLRQEQLLQLLRAAAEQGRLPAAEVEATAAYKPDLNKLVKFEA